MRARVQITSSYINARWACQAYLQSHRKQRRLNPQSQLAQLVSSGFKREELPQSKMVSDEGSRLPLIFGLPGAYGHVCVHIAHTCATTHEKTCNAHVPMSIPYTYICKKKRATLGAEEPIHVKISCNRTETKGQSNVWNTHTLI